MTPKQSWVSAHAIVTLVLSSSCNNVGERFDRHPLQFEALAIPSQVAVGAPFEIDTSFFVGPNGCWQVENFEVKIEESTIRLEGNAIMPFPDGVCTQATVHGRRTAQIEALTPGIYEVRAGVLADTLEVVPGTARSFDRFAFAGRVRGDSNGCDAVGSSAIWVALSGLPRDMSTSIDAVVLGDIVDTETCGFPGSPEQFDYNVSVRELVELER